MTSRLLDILGSIRPMAAIGPTQFAATIIPGFQNHFVGRNSSGQPCLLIKTSDNGFLAPIKLAALEVQFCIPCEVVLPNGDTERYHLTVVTCTVPDQELQAYFLHLMDTVIRIIGQQPSLHTVSESIGKLVEILQQLAKPSRRSVIGLFAEVMMIALSDSPVRCVSAWRSSADDRFDFALDDARLEVKATSDRIRAHNFSLEQCNPPRGTQAVVASFFVEPNGAGQSLGELLHKAGQRLSGDTQALLKLRTVVANSLGSTLPSALQMRFDDALARSMLAFFLVETIPAIRDAVPRGVSRVRFRSDLTGIVPVKVAQLARECPALQLLLPTDIER